MATSPKCDTCNATMNLFAALDEKRKYHPCTQHRCGFCLEDDKSMKYINGKWVKFNSMKNIDEFRKGEL